MGVRSEIGGLYTWTKANFRINFGRLMMMIPGVAVTVFAANEFRPMTDSEFRTAMTFGAVVLVGGYLAPSVKRLSWGKATMETHDLRASLEESREAATELTEEVASGVGADVEPDEAISAARFFAANVAMSGVLYPSSFGGAELHVYLMDEAAGGLVPAFGISDEVADQPPWRPGVGAVGKAYSSKQSVVAIGEEARDGTHGLDVGQRAQHSRTSAVAASPILNANGAVIGVVSASEHDRPLEESYLATQEGRDGLVVAADACARILVDLLGWFADDV